MSDSTHIECPCRECEAMREIRAWHTANRERDEESNRLFGIAMGWALLEASAFLLVDGLIIELPQWGVGATCLSGFFYGGWRGWSKP